MSEPYAVNMGYFRHQVEREDTEREVVWAPNDALVLQVALVERLERLVEVLEQIRDRPPTSYTT